MVESENKKEAENGENLPRENSNIRLLLQQNKWLTDNRAKLIIQVAKGRHSIKEICFHAGLSYIYVANELQILLCGGILIKQKGYHQRETYYSITADKWTDLALAWLNRVASERVKEVVEPDKEEIKGGEVVGVEGCQGQA